MRTLIYARYSSHLQNSRSIEDQIAVCRERCAREGWPVLEIFTDYAISGAAGIDEGARPGLNAALERIEAGGVDQLLAESTDRLARHQGDAYAIRERISFAGARIFTLSDGEVDDITGTIKGLFDARFRKELGAKIKRGQRGTVADRRVPAGLAFGYRTANRIDDRGRAIRGLREIDPEQAAVVVRIFTEYAAGESPRAIAERLNAEGVPGPRGRAWRASTIRGDLQRRDGMLQNRIYAGEIVHNRTSKVTDPRTRKTLIRPNPESEWIREPAPELQIVDDRLWEAAQDSRGRNAQGPRPERARRPKHLLSGLAVCGVCGGGWAVIGGGQWGCGRNRDGGGCTNNRRIETHVLEARVLKGLREKILDPAAVALFVGEYHRAHKHTMREQAHDRVRLEKAIAEATARIDRLVAAIERGADIEEVREALAGAKAQRAEAERELAGMESANVVALHPRIADAYRARVEELTAALADPFARIGVVPKIRSLIERIVVTPAESGRGTQLLLEGRLGNLLAIATGQTPDLTRGTVTVERVKGIVRYRAFARASV